MNSYDVREGKWSSVGGTPGPFTEIHGGEYGPTILVGPNSLHDLARRKSVDIVHGPAPSEDGRQAYIDSSHELWSTDGLESQVISSPLELWADQDLAIQWSVSLNGTLLVGFDGRVYSWMTGSELPTRLKTSQNPSGTYSEGWRDPKRPEVAWLFWENRLGVEKAGQLFKATRSGLRQVGGDGVVPLGFSEEGDFLWWKGDTLYADGSTGSQSLFEIPKELGIDPGSKIWVIGGALLALNTWTHELVVRSSLLPGLPWETVGTRWSSISRVHYRNGVWTVEGSGDEGSKRALTLERESDQLTPTGIYTLSNGVLTGEGNETLELDLNELFASDAIWKRDRVSGRRLQFKNGRLINQLEIGGIFERRGPLEPTDVQFEAGVAWTFVDGKRVPLWAPLTPSLVGESDRDRDSTGIVPLFLRPFVWPYRGRVLLQVTPHQAPAPMVFNRGEFTLTPWAELAGRNVINTDDYYLRSTSEGVALTVTKTGESLFEIPAGSLWPGVRKGLEVVYVDDLFYPLVEGWPSSESVDPSSVPGAIPFLVGAGFVVPLAGGHWQSVVPFRDHWIEPAEDPSDYLVRILMEGAPQGVELLDQGLVVRLFEDPKEPALVREDGHWVIKAVQGQIGMAPRKCDEKGRPFVDQVSGISTNGEYVFMRTEAGSFKVGLDGSIARGQVPSFRTTEFSHGEPSITVADGWLEIGFSDRYRSIRLEDGIIGSTYAQKVWSSRKSDTWVVAMKDGSQWEVSEGKFDRIPNTIPFSLPTGRGLHSPFSNSDNGIEWKASECSQSILLGSGADPQFSAVDTFVDYMPARGGVYVLTESALWMWRDGKRTVVTDSLGSALTGSRLLLEVGPTFEHARLYLQGPRGDYLLEGTSGVLNGEPVALVSHPLQRSGRMGPLSWNGLGGFSLHVGDDERPITFHGDTLGYGQIKDLELRGRDLFLLSSPGVEFTLREHSRWPAALRVQHQLQKHAPPKSVEVSGGALRFRPTETAGVEAEIRMASGSWKPLGRSSFNGQFLHDIVRRAAGRKGSVAFVTEAGVMTGSASDFSKWNLLPEIELEASDSEIAFNDDGQVQLRIGANAYSLASSGWELLTLGESEFSPLKTMVTVKRSGPWRGVSLGGLGVGIERRGGDGTWAATRFLPELGAMSLDVLSGDSTPRIGKKGLQWNTRAGWVEISTTNARGMDWMGSDNPGPAPTSKFSNPSGTLEIHVGEAFPVQVLLSKGSASVALRWDVREGRLPHDRVNDLCWIPGLDRLALATDAGVREMWWEGTEAKQSLEHFGTLRPLAVQSTTTDRSVVAVQTVDGIEFLREVNGWVRMSPPAYRQLEEQVERREGSVLGSKLSWGSEHGAVSFLLGGRPLDVSNKGFEADIAELGFVLDGVRWLSGPAGLFRVGAPALGVAGLVWTGAGIQPGDIHQVMLRGERRINVRGGPEGVGLTPSEVLEIEKNPWAAFGSNNFNVAPTGHGGADIDWLAPRGNAPTRKLHIEGVSFLHDNLGDILNVSLGGESVGHTGATELLLMTTGGGLVLRSNPQYELLDILEYEGASRADALGFSGSKLILVSGEVCFEVRIDPHLELIPLLSTPRFDSIYDGPHFRIGKRLDSGKNYVVERRRSDEDWASPELLSSGGGALPGDRAEAAIMHDGHMWLVTNDGVLDFSNGEGKGWVPDIGLASPSISMDKISEQAVEGSRAIHWVSSGNLWTTFMLGGVAQAFCYTGGELTAVTNGDAVADSAITGSVTDWTWRHGSAGAPLEFTYQNAVLNGKKASVRTYSMGGALGVDLCLGLGSGGGEALALSSLGAVVADRAPQMGNLLVFPDDVRLKPSEGGANSEFFQNAAGANVFSSTAGAYKVNVNKLVPIDPEIDKGEIRRILHSDERWAWWRGFAGGLHFDNKAIKGTIFGPSEIFSRGQLALDRIQHVVDLEDTIWITTAVTLERLSPSGELEYVCSLKLDGFLEGLVEQPLAEGKLIAPLITTPSSITAQVDGQTFAEEEVSTVVAVGEAGGEEPYTWTRLGISSGELVIVNGHGDTYKLSSDNHLVRTADPVSLKEQEWEVKRDGVELKVTPEGYRQFGVLTDFESRVISVEVSNGRLWLLGPEGLSWLRLEPRWAERGGYSPSDAHR